MYMACRYVAIISGIAGGVFSLYTGSVVGVVAPVVTLVGFLVSIQYCDKIKAGLVREIESLKFNVSVSSDEIDQLNALVKMQTATIEELSAPKVEVKAEPPAPQTEEPLRGLAAWAAKRKALEADQ